jgi:hypothetical protein
MHGIHEETHVLSRRGYMPLRDVVNGDTTVWTGAAWTPAKVRAREYGDLPCVEVRFTGERSIIVAAGHEIWTTKGMLPAAMLETGMFVRSQLPTDDKRITWPINLDSGWYIAGREGLRFPRDVLTADSQAKMDFLFGHLNGTSLQTDADIALGVRRLVESMGTRCDVSIIGSRVLTDEPLMKVHINPGREIEVRSVEKVKPGALYTVQHFIMADGVVV